MPLPRPSRRVRGRGSTISRPAIPVPTSCGSRGSNLPHGSPRHRVLHFYVPIIEGREIISVDSRGVLATSRSDLDDGPVIFVDIDTDGNFFTDYRVPGEPFESIDQLIHAAGVHLLTGSCRDLPQYEGQQHVGSTASSSSQMPVTELQHLYSEAFRRLPCKEEGLVAEPACVQTRQQHDLSPLKDLLNATTLEELSTTATSSSSVQMPAQPWRCLSSSPIWALPRLDWGITFYTRVDLDECYHTYPHVGGPFQSLQEAYIAIDCYLQKQQDPTMSLVHFSCFVNTHAIDYIQSFKQGDPGQCCAMLL